MLLRVCSQPRRRLAYAVEFLKTLGVGGRHWYSCRWGWGVSGHRKGVGKSALEALRPIEPLPFPAQQRTGVFHLH